ATGTAIDRRKNRIGAITRVLRFDSLDFALNRSERVLGVGQAIRVELHLRQRGHRAKRMAEENGVGVDYLITAGSALLARKTINPDSIFIVRKKISTLTPFSAQERMPTLTPVCGQKSLPSPT